MIYFNRKYVKFKNEAHSINNVKYILKKRENRLSKHYLKCIISSECEIYT